jgi:hypothetical protein
MHCKFNSDEVCLHTWEDKFDSPNYPEDIVCIACQLERLGTIVQNKTFYKENY